MLMEELAGTSNSEYYISMRICKTCGRSFKPSSTHKDCPSCRYHKSKTILCHICKKYYHSAKYANCRHCTNTIRSDYGTGRYKRPNGYIMVFQKGHPRSSKNYIFEHILVMEQYLGRYVTKDESVHHKAIPGKKQGDRNTTITGNVGLSRSAFRMAGVRCCAALKSRSRRQSA